MPLVNGEYISIWDLPAQHVKAGQVFMLYDEIGLPNEMIALRDFNVTTERVEYLYGGVTEWGPTMWAWFKFCGLADRVEKER